MGPSSMKVLALEALLVGRVLLHERHDELARDREPECTVLRLDLSLNKPCDGLLLGIIMAPHTLKVDLGRVILQPMGSDI